MSRYVYSLAGRVTHAARAGDDLNPLCGAAFRGPFTTTTTPPDRPMCAMCTRALNARGVERRRAERDARIVALLAQGLSDSAVGRRLGWARRTRVRHVNEAMRRAGARSRFQWGYRVGYAEGRKSA